MMKETIYRFLFHVLKMLMWSVPTSDFGKFVVIIRSLVELGIDSKLVNK